MSAPPPSPEKTPPPDSAADDLKVFKPLRAGWHSELESLLRRGVTGQALAADLTGRWDDLLTRHFHEALGEAVESCVLLALGGYGRQAMAPFSDVDLMVLVEEGADRRVLSAVERFIQALWSAGVKLGHSVRTPEQCWDLAQDDTQVATSLLDARPISGAVSALPPVATTVRDLLVESGTERFVELVRRGIRARRRKYGDSAYLLEPQLKQGRGGLRDLHALGWTAHLHFGVADLAALVARGSVVQEEAERLAAAHSFLLRTRFALHLHHGWKQDQLTYAAQGPVAARMGFGEEHVHESVNRFMQAYYLHARAIASISDLWFEEWTHPDDGDESALPLDVLTSEPTALYALLGEAASKQQHLSPSARRALAVAGPKLPRESAVSSDANRVVRSIICGLDDPEDLLAIIAKTGILARVVPEWAHLTAHAQHDTYHVYTTDEHLLVTCRRMKSLLRGDLERRSPYLTGVAHRYVDRAATDALVLAALLHDVGKGLGADHSVIGAGMAAEVARRMGLSNDDQALIRELVIEHLTMPKVSQRRDIHDRATLDAFCSSVDRPLLLDALTMLSFVDMDSVGPGHLNQWKLSLLEELHRAAAKHLQAEGRPQPEAAKRSLELLRAVLERDLSPEALEELIARLPARLVEIATTPQLVRCARLLAGDRDEPRVAIHDASDASSTEVLVFQPQRPDRLAEVAGILDATGLDIRKARSNSVPGGGSLGIFEVRTLGDGRDLIPERRRRALAADIVGVIDGSRRFEEILDEKLSQSRLPPKKRPNVTTSVQIDNGFDPSFTIVEVKAPDRPGLLAHLTRGLRDLSLDVDRSIITTEGDRAIDTFYVTESDGRKLDDRRAAAARRSLMEQLGSLGPSD